MATTSGNLTAGKAITEQGGNGKGYKRHAAGLIATAALGLGLLAETLLGHERQAVTPSANLSGATAPHVYIALGDRDDPRFASASTFIPDRFTYREDHRAPVSLTASDFSWAIADGIRPGLLIPGLEESPNPSFVPDQFTYREDRRSDGASGSRIWTGTCRAGSSECLPGDDDVAPGLPVARPQVWTGTCRAGGSDCLPDEESVVPAQPVASPRGWTGSCRPGGSDCVPDEDIPAVGSAQAARPAEASITTEYRWDFPSGPIVAIAADHGEDSDNLRWCSQTPGPFACAATAASLPTYRESHDLDILPAFVPDQFTYREDHRASSNPLVTSFLPGKSGRKVYA